MVASRVDLAPHKRPYAHEAPRLEGLLAAVGALEPTVLVRRFLPGQGNNAYIFPGVGLGVVAAEATRVTDEMFSAAARTLAALVGPADLEVGRIYPALSRLREVSLEIATTVATVAWSRGLTRKPRPPNVREEVAAAMYQPAYLTYA